MDSPTSLADWLANWFGTIAVTIAIVAVTTWLVVGGCAKAKRKRESSGAHGLSAANAVTLQQEIARVYRADGSGCVGGLDEGPMVSATDYLGAIEQWRQHVGPYLPNDVFSEVKLPSKSRQNGTFYTIKPGAKEFRKNDPEISTGMPRCRDCTVEHLCEAAVAKAAEAAPKGSNGLVPMEFDLMQPAIINVVELAAMVGVRKSYLERADTTINAHLAKFMRRHREAAHAGASVNRFSVVLFAGPTADVSEAVRSAALVAQAGKSLTSIAADARSSDARRAGCAGNGRKLGPNASAEEVAARTGWIRSRPQSLAQRAENIANGSYPAWLKKKNDASPQSLVDRAKRIADGTYPAWLEAVLDGLDKSEHLSGYIRLVYGLPSPYLELLVSNGWDCAILALLLAAGFAERLFSSASSLPLENFPLRFDSRQTGTSRALRRAAGLVGVATIPFKVVGWYTPDAQLMTNYLDEAERARLYPFLRYFLQLDDVYINLIMLVMYILFEVKCLGRVVCRRNNIEAPYKEADGLIERIDKLRLDHRTELICLFKLYNLSLVCVRAKPSDPFHFCIAACFAHAYPGLTDDAAVIAAEKEYDVLHAGPLAAYLAYKKVAFFNKRPAFAVVRAGEPVVKTPAGSYVFHRPELLEMFVDPGAYLTAAQTADLRTAQEALLLALAPATSA